MLFFIKLLEPVEEVSEPETTPKSTPGGTPVTPLRSPGGIVPEGTDFPEAHYLQA